MTGLGTEDPLSSLTPCSRSIPSSFALSCLVAWVQPPHHERGRDIELTTRKLTTPRSVHDSRSRGGATPRPELVTRTRRR